MSTHLLITLILTLTAGGATAVPLHATPATSYATEAELLAAPGSAGYPVPGDDLVDGDDGAPAPLCEEGAEDDGDEVEPGDEPGDGGDGGGDAGAPDGDDGDDDEPGC